MQKYTDRRSFPLARVCKQEQNTGGGRDRQKADRNRQERTRVSDRKNTQTSSSVTFGDAHKPTAVFLNIWLSLQFAELNWMPKFIVASRLWHHHRNTIRRVRGETLQARLIYDPKTQKQLHTLDSGGWRWRERNVSAAQLQFHLHMNWFTSPEQTSACFQPVWSFLIVSDEKWVDIRKRETRRSNENLLKQHERKVNILENKFISLLLRVRRSGHLNLMSG